MKSFILRVIFFYVIFGGIWILLSDTLLFDLVADLDALETIQTYKGWAFVAASAFVIYLLLRRELQLREQIENELLSSQERLQTVLNSAPIVLLAMDKNGIFTQSQGAGLRRTGLQPGQVVGQSAYELYGVLNITLSDGSIIPGGELIRRVFEGETLSATTELNGTCFENIFAPILGKNGTIEGMVGISIDITERKQLEESLLRTELQYRTLVEQVPPIIYMTGLEQYIGVTYISPRISILGFTQDEWVADPELWVRQLHPDDRGYVLEQLEEIKRTGELVKLEYRILTREGEVKWFLDEVMNVTDDGGKFVFRQGIMLDITDIKKAEEELRLHRDRLGELSRRLARIQETERRAIGRELHDQIGQMLTAIKITLDMLPNLPVDLATKKIEQAREITSDLLNRVSRLSLELRPPMLDDLGVIPALLWHVNHYHEQSGIHIDFTHQGMDGVRFDPEVETAVYRIIQEALTNVARHANAGRIRLEVWGGGGQIQIRVEDNGKGFDPATAFAQNRGLVGMRERARLLNGSVEVETKQGIGTKVFVQIPLLGGA